MKTPPQYEIELLKLADGSRLIRVSDPVTATALERRLDLAKPVWAQKNGLTQALQTLLANELSEIAPTT